MKPAAPMIDWTGFSWTGFYAGGQIGYAWGANHGGYSYATPGGLAGSNPLIGDEKGIIFGGHVGYNRQIDNWVVGLEGSVDGTNLFKISPLAVNDPSQDNLNVGTLTATVQSGIQGAVRARAGYAFGRLLTFATGGVAFGDFSFQSNLASNWSALNAFYAVNNGQSVVACRLDYRRRRGMGAQQALVGARRIPLHGFRQIHRRAEWPASNTRRVLFRRASPG